MRTEDGAELRLPVLGYKPLVGVVHLPPLPGRRVRSDVEELIEYAVAEARKLEDAGFDAVIVENYGDKPYHIEQRDPFTVAVMSIIVREIVKATSLRVGVNVLRNDPVAAASIAAAAGAWFIRANSLCETRVSPEGILYPKAAELSDKLASLPRPVIVLADIDVKHSWRIAGDPASAAIECSKRADPAALIVTGERTGSPPSPGYVASIRAAAGKPVIVGSGVDHKNIELYMSISDGVIVGTALKREGGTEAPIDPEKARRLAAKARQARGRAAR